MRRALLSLGLLSLVAPPALARNTARTISAAEVETRSLPKDQVVAPTTLFRRADPIERAIIDSNPLLYVYPEFDRAAGPLLVVGMDGWGGRAENLMEALRRGLRSKALARRLVLAVIQDPVTGGPEFQGQHSREHANAWMPVAVPELHRFVERLAGMLGPLQVYFVGFSTGATAAPAAALRVAKRARGAAFRVAGAIAVGGWSVANPEAQRALKQRVAFIVAPRKRRKEAPAHRYDQNNRDWAEATHEALRRGRADSTLVHIESVRRHPDWHWGLLSQCRFFPEGERVKPGRGKWPYYALPNPDTFWAIREFLEGKRPSSPPPHPPTKCPY
jgi:hypothetical protein